MPLRRLPLHIALVCAAGISVAGCSGSSNFLDSKNEGGLFSKPMDVFAKPDWARPSSANVSLGPSGPVGPEDLVNADGSCAPPSADAAQAAAAPPPPAAGAVPDRLQPDGVGAPAAPQVMGGIALGMSECQAVRRAGQPGNVSIGADASGERKVVLTYASGPWPGIYTFTSGRLKTIDMVPEQQKPRAPAKKPKRARSAAHETERVYVQ
ncbi:hypothetical protein [Pseudolabrys taiwanensis]|uniref:hypothetical protein n=1 Tax=Pseudolabrys taiwanensis TaxID=331696 RepID=UPI0013B359E0|nr:hypothetical protein [Pseudolabrys taiwanensis]